MRTTSIPRAVSLVFVAAGVLSGCADYAVTSPSDLEPAASVAGAVRSDLDVCANLAAPAGSRLVLRAYANGVQIYRWNGSQWSFVAPDAVLTADRGGAGVIGTHYEGPTWESNSGSKVEGAVRDRCTPEPAAIAWLLLDATPKGGPGIFRRVTSIQRLHTTGGMAPSAPGSFVGEEARIPYTAEYRFFRS